MKNRNQILIVTVVLALVTMACAIPFTTPKPAPITGTPRGSNTAVKTLPVLPTVSRATSTSVPESTPSVDPQQPVVTRALAADALLQVILKLEDLPQGFNQLDAAAQQQIGITQDTVSGMFQGMFATASLSNFFAYLNPETDHYQLVMGGLFSPLSSKESAGFDLELNNPEKATQSFTSGLGGNAQVLTAAGGLGEKSIGFTFTVPADAITLRGDMVLVRRGNVVFLLLTMYQDGTTPGIGAIQLATILDNRLKTALGN